MNRDFEHYSGSCMRELGVLNIGDQKVILPTDPLAQDIRLYGQIGVESNRDGVRIVARARDYNLHSDGTITAGDYRQPLTNEWDRHGYLDGEVHSIDYPMLHIGRWMSVVYTDGSLLIGSETLSHGSDGHSALKPLILRWSRPPCEVVLCCTADTYKSDRPMICCVSTTGSLFVTINLGEQWVKCGGDDRQVKAFGALHKCHSTSDNTQPISIVSGMYVLFEDGDLCRVGAYGACTPILSGVVDVMELQRVRYKTPRIKSAASVSE